MPKPVRAETRGMPSERWIPSDARIDVTSPRLPHELAKARRAAGRGGVADAAFATANRSQRRSRSLRGNSSRSRAALCRARGLATCSGWQRFLCTSSTDRVAAYGNHLKTRTPRPRASRGSERQQISLTDPGARLDGHELTVLLHGPDSFARRNCRESPNLGNHTK